ncbi:MAG: AAA family ATPase, partial [Nitrososphaerales archaeon]
MVHLKKVETRGFKSLGSKLISTPVERGFVAITGPNGSGKSNLLDAILFALGENSAKTLRVPNLQGLIYDGSVEEQKPSSTRVSLQFDNTDRRIPVDSDSVTITRELKISGESLYSLNGKHVQRNNLSELLEMALIASRGLNIVLQGMITRISELVPDEKRKLIEQMVGIAQFDEKKQQALTQLRDADVKLEVAMAKIGEIRDRVQSLEQQRNDQLRIKQLEDQIRWLRAAAASTKLNTVRR